MSKKYLVMNGIDCRVATAFEKMERDDFSKWCRKELRPLDHGSVTYDALDLVLKVKNGDAIGSTKANEESKKVKKTRKSDQQKD